MYAAIGLKIVVLIKRILVAQTEHQKGHRRIFLL